MAAPEGSRPSTSAEVVLAEIRRFVASELLIERDIAPDDRLVEDLGLDSITLTSLAVALEDHFRVLLSDEEAARVQTVAELVRLVVARVSAAAAEAAP